MQTSYTNFLVPQIYLNPGLFVSVGGGSAWFTGSLQTIQPSFVALQPSSTSYIFLNLLTSTIQLNTTGFTSTTYPVAIAVTGASSISSLTDVRPDLSIGTGGGGSPNYETPSGTINGVNKTFTLVNAPNPMASLLLFRNGVSQINPTSYSISNNTITFVTAPGSGDLLQAYYSIAGGGGGGGGSANFADGEIPGGTVNGSNVTFTLAFSPSPALSLELFQDGLLQQAGGGDFTLSASTITFTSAPHTGAHLQAWYRH